MSNDSSILVVIPARGGSKGIPRKNLRPMNGRPLISYSIATALSSRHLPTVCVSSDDEEILSFAGRSGAVALRRPESLAGDAVTLDPVVHHAVVEMESRVGSAYAVVVTMQPTSPLLRRESLDAAIDKMLADPSIATILSAKEDAHLSWREEDGRFVPNYRERLNRQLLPREYRETGGFVVSRRGVVTPRGRIAEPTSLQLLSGAEAIDIDDLEDWSACEHYLRKKRILFVVTGHREVGLGHVYNSLAVANEILGHELGFLVDSKSALALEKIASFNYPVAMQAAASILDDIAKIEPDVVINDRLDTDRPYMAGLKALGCKIINFEDLGPGIEEADLVINAIYPEKEPRPGHYFGHDYFVLRDDFFKFPPKRASERVGEVLVSFGGTDPNDYTRRVLEEIAPACRARGASLTAVLGYGYGRAESLPLGDGIVILSNVSDMAARMASADLAFSSAGRTTYELAAVGTPTIVLTQNDREATHSFASAEYGFVNLGGGAGLPPGGIAKVFERLCDDREIRQRMTDTMRGIDLRDGRKNVMKLIYRLLEA